MLTMKMVIVRVSGQEFKKVSKDLIIEQIHFMKGQKGDKFPKSENG